MFKRKLKFSLILLLLLAIVTCTISFADNETDVNDAVVTSLDSETISEESLNEEESEESLLTQVKEYYKEYYESYLGEDAISGDIYKMDTEDIEITKNISGNIFILGNNVTISSQIIHGDVYILASDVTLSAYEISGSVYVCANNLKVDNSMIDYSLYAIANDIDFYGATLDMYVTANTLTLQENSCIQRDLHSTSNTLNLYGAVCRDAYATFENLNILDEEKLSDSETISGVFGNFEYSAPESKNFPEGFINGEAKYTKLESNPIPSATDIAISILESVVFILIVLAVLHIFANKFKNNASLILSNHLGKIILKGLLFLILTPIIFILLCMLGITAKVAFVLLGIYFILLAISSAILVIALANLISNKFKFNNVAGKIGILILTAIIYAGLTKLPYAGSVISIVATTLGLGIIIENLSSKKKNNNIVTVTSEVEPIVDETSKTTNTEISENKEPSNVDPIDNKSEDNNNE